MRSSLVCLSFLPLFAAAAPAEEESRPPNVLLILTDDQGWGDIHSHGAEGLDTPNLDRLAEQGARFDR
ncbi:MAG: sulfatase-like hydrolase/transferase, partial [Planctomycetota bacterium]